MALIKCPDCGKLVSPRAEMCPECGCPAEYFLKNVSDELREKEEYKELRLRIERRIEDGRDTSVLIAVDDDGTETKISNNHGKDVIDFCQTEKYVFYILYDSDENEGRNYLSISTSHIYRYEKTVGTIERITPDKGLKIENGKSYYRVKCNDSKDAYRDKEGKLMPKKMFSNENIIVLHLQNWNEDIDGAIITMDFNGNPIRIVWRGEYKVFAEILWLYGDDLWLITSKDFEKRLIHYSLTDKEMETVCDKWSIAVTNGKIIYFVPHENKYNEYKGDYGVYYINMDATGLKKHCEIKNDDNYGTIEDMRVSNIGDLFLKYKNYEMQLLEGKTYSMEKFIRKDAEYSFNVADDLDKVRKLKKIYRGELEE